MQARKSLQELAVEITRQKMNARDFIGSAQKMEVMVPGNVPELALEGVGSFPIGKYAGKQIAQRLEIPTRYFDKMKEEEPGLLAANVNTWLKKSEDKHMIRTMDGNCRAFLSDRYRPIDNWIVAEGVLDTIGRSGVQIKILSSEITERKMYLQLVTPEIQAEVRKGEFIQAGLTISNSEIGHGSASFVSLIYFLACLNGMKGTKSFKKYHVGSRLGNTNGMDFTAFSDETRGWDDKAFIGAMKDLTKQALSDVALEAEVGKLRAATEHEMHLASMNDTIEEIKKVHSLTEAESSGVLGRLVKGGDLTQYGLSNAVTNLANDQEEVSDYDRVIELQKVGADIMYMSEKDFNVMNKREAA